MPPPPHTHNHPNPPASGPLCWAVSPEGELPSKEQGFPPSCISQVPVAHNDRVSWAQKLLAMENFWHKVSLPPSVHYLKAPNDVQRLGSSCPTAPHFLACLTEEGEGPCLMLLPTLPICSAWVSLTQYKTSSAEILSDRTHLLRHLCIKKKKKILKVET